MRLRKPVINFLETQNVKGAIDFEHVAFGYDLGRTLIKDLNIQVPAD